MEILNWLPTCRRHPAPLLICLILLSSQASAATDAIVTMVRGNARLGSDAVRRFEQLGYQQTITLAAESQLVLVDLRSTRQYVLKGPGQFTLAADGVRHQGGTVQDQTLPAAYRGMMLERQTATHAGATLRGAGSGDEPGWPALDADQDDERILPQGATLRWPMRPHRGTWQLRLTERDGKMLYQADVVANQLQLPDSLVLAPEQDYRQELEWRGGNGMLQSRVTTIHTVGTGLAQQVLARVPAVSAPESERWLYVVWLRSLGLRGQAAQFACSLAPEFC